MSMLLVCFVNMEKKPVLTNSLSSALAVPGRMWYYISPSESGEQERLQAAQEPSGGST
jgi:hypothetical protein